MEDAFKFDQPGLVVLKLSTFLDQLLHEIALLAKMFVLEGYRLRLDGSVMIVQPEFLWAFEIIEIGGFCETIFHSG